ncbi:MAG: hypothetical protein H6999_02320 [Hahellaceae bacterium]|nr:hypothetical protein [Hahellaceae bacterium]MCP5168577.1 hypothetical protein [Hahellaceae bacterium]
MKALWLSLNEKYLALSLRERMIVFSALVILIVFGWLTFYFDVVEKKQATFRQKITTVDDEIARMATQVGELQTRLDNDPNLILKSEQRQLNAQLDALNADIESRLSGLLAPEQMLDALRKTISAQTTVRLLGVRNLPAAPYQLVNPKRAEMQAAESGHEGDEKAAIYSHQMEVVLEGDYFSVVRYVQQLEMQSGFYMQSLDYEVIDYPKAKVTLRVSTLSLEEAWIGV